MNSKSINPNTKKLAGLALFTAIIFILQIIGSFIRFGPFSISLVLVPIVVGAAMYGIAAGAYLGAIFGLVVLISGDASLFLTINPIGTIVLVLVKGIACGAAAAFAYKLFEKKSRFVAVLMAAIVCPIFNTGIFLLGCLVFFMGTITAWAEASGFGSNVGAYMILGLVGLNFVFEFLFNVLISNVILHIINIGKKGVSGGKHDISN